MDKGFTFVDGTMTDRSTRRVARSHAMKGKNIGKTHQRRSRLGLGQMQKYKSPIPLQNFGDQYVKKTTDRPAHCLHRSTDQLPICQPLPQPLLIETTSRGLDIIKNYFTFAVEAVYTPQLCLSLDGIKSYWIQMMFVDSTSYHCSLALMAILNGFVFASEAVSLEATHHLGQAVGLVNQKLGTAEGLSNSSISVVNFLVVREIFREDQSSAEIHLKGLRKMIELRGGLSQLQDRTLTLKICKTDIDYALQYGTSTGFYRDRLSEVAQAEAVNELIISASVYAKPTFDKIDPFLQRILRDANDVAYRFNKDRKGFKVEPEVLQEVIVSVGYRLVRFHALNESQLENKLDATYHIGLIAFTATLFLQVGRRHFLRYNLVAQCLRNVIIRGELNEEDNDVLMWLLLIGGISVLTEADRSWLVPQILRVARSVNIESWAQLHQLLIQFPWICPIHDEPGKALWTSAIEHESRLDENYIPILLL